ncbi:MAG: cation diffusion facilitator family transporter [candidate division Zixibacteria bacterium]|nr:cation diffusion facilitator family transporter [candidate division Zixibacteria bacterium]
MNDRDDHISPTAAPGTDEASRDIRRVSLWGVAVNLLLTVLKIGVGIVSSSLALVMDGIHSVADSITDVTILVGRRYWSAPPDERHPHGHGRVETLVTLVIGLLVLVTGVGLVYRAVTEIPESVGITSPTAVLVVAVASLIGKEWLYRWTIVVGERYRSTAVVANAWHHRSDAMSSIPVVIAVVGFWIRPEWHFLDPVAAILVGVLVGHAAREIIWPAVQDLVDTAPSRSTRAALHQIIEDTNGVLDTHAVRVRRVGAGLHIDLHIHVDPNITVHAGHEIATAVRQRLKKSDHHVVDVVVHVEPHDEPHD